MCKQNRVIRRCACVVIIELDIEMVLFHMNLWIWVINYWLWIRKSFTTTFIQSENHVCQLCLFIFVHRFLKVGFFEDHSSSFITISATKNFLFPGTYIDKKCPFTGDVSIRGRILAGTCHSAKMMRTIIVRRNYLHYVKKYQRWEVAILSKSLLVSLSSSAN